MDGNLIEKTISAMRAAGYRIQKCSPYRPPWYSQDVACPDCGGLMRVVGRSVNDHGRELWQASPISARANDSRTLSTDYTLTSDHVTRSGFHEQSEGLTMRVYPYECDACNQLVPAEDARRFVGEIPAYALLGFQIVRG